MDTSATQLAAAIRELNEPLHSFFTSLFSDIQTIDAANSAQQDQLGEIEADVAALDTDVADHETRIAALEALDAGNATDTPTVAEMTADAPIFTNGRFKGLDV